MADDAALKHTEIITQYQTLRTEILHNDTVGLQQLGATIIIVGAAMGYAFKDGQDELFRTVVFTCAALISVTSMKQTFVRIKSTFMIASYMRMFLEPKTENIKWEMRLLQFRKLEDGVQYKWFEKMRKKLRLKKADDNVRFKRFQSILSTYFYLGLGNCILGILHSIVLSETKRSDLLIFNNYAPNIIDMRHVAYVLCAICIIITIYSIIIHSVEYKKYIMEYQNTFDGKWLEADKKLNEKRGVLANSEQNNEVPPPDENNAFAQ